MAIVRVWKRVKFKCTYCSLDSPAVAICTPTQQHMITTTQMDIPIILPKCGVETRVTVDFSSVEKIWTISLLLMSRCFLRYSQLIYSTNSHYSHISREQSVYGAQCLRFWIAYLFYPLENKKFSMIILIMHCEWKRADFFANIWITVAISLQIVISHRVSR